MSHPSWSLRPEPGHDAATCADLRVSGVWPGLSRSQMRAGQPSRWTWSLCRGSSRMPARSVGQLRCNAPGSSSLVELRLPSRLWRRSRQQCAGATAVVRTPPPERPPVPSGPLVLPPFPGVHLARQDKIRGVGQAAKPSDDAMEYSINVRHTCYFDREAHLLEDRLSEQLLMSHPVGNIGSQLRH